MTQKELDWDDVTTIILVDSKGVTYKISKIQLLRLLTPQLEDALREIWESLTAGAKG